MRSLVAILAVVGATLLAGCVTKEQTELTPTPHGEATTTYGKVMDKAEEAPCDQYLGQLNQAVQLYVAANEAFPPDLATVIRESGLPESELKYCKYTYDPATGRVTLVR